MIIIMDLDKYKNKQPYPDRSKILEELKEKIGTKDFTVPATGLFDKDGFIKLHVNPAYAAMIAKYNRGAREAEAEFQQDAEEEFGMEGLPEKCRALIHAAAWERGHSYGLSDVVIHYPQLVEIALAAREGDTEPK